MATEREYLREEQFPPNYLAQFYSGAPGTNVPGIMPLLNQELVNRMMGFGVEGANPYTYSGERIADFAPAEREAMRMTAEGMGSYLPYFQRGEQLTESGLGAVTDAYGDTRNLIDQAVQAGEMSTEEAMGLLRQAPGIAGQATQAGMGQIDASGRELRGARDVTGGGLGRLSQAAGTGYGATGMFSPGGSAGILGGPGGTPPTGGYGGVSDFYNPYEEQVVQQTMEDVRKGLAQGDIARRAGEIGAGAFGGSRSRLAGQELAEAAARGATQQVGAIRAGGYQDAARRAQAAFESQQARQANQANLLAGLGAQQSDIGARLGTIAGQRAGMGTQIAGLGSNLAGMYGTTAGGIGSLGGNLANIYGGAAGDVFGAGAQLGQLGMGAGQQMSGLGYGASQLLGTDINRMMGIGGMQRGMDQRGLDLGYGNFVGQYNLPMQTLGQVGDMATGWSPAMGGTTLQQKTTGQQTNPLMQAAGTALTAYGAFNNPSGSTATGGVHQGPPTNLQLNPQAGGTAGLSPPNPYLTSQQRGRGMGMGVR